MNQTPRGGRSAISAISPLLGIAGIGWAESRPRIEAGYQLGAILRTALPSPLSTSGIFGSGGAVMPGAMRERYFLKTRAGEHIR
jgi:hypothetical protein